MDTLEKNCLVSTWGLWQEVLSVIYFPVWTGLIVAEDGVRCVQCQIE